MKMVARFKVNRRPAMEPTMSHREIAMELGIKSAVTAITVYGALKPEIMNPGRHTRRDTYYARSEAKRFIEWYRMKYQSKQ